MTEYLVGTVGFPIQRNKVLERVTLVELTDARHIPPSTRAARRMAADIPDGVRLSVQASQFFAETAPQQTTLKGDPSAYGAFQLSDEMRSLWQRQIDFATELNAAAIVLITPPSITPSSFFIDRIQGFFDAMRPWPVPVVWEPHGPWDMAQAQALSAQLGLVLAVDPLRDDPMPGDVAYFRFGPFSVMGARMGAYELDRIAAAGEGFDTVCCAFDTRRALDDAHNLQHVLNSGTLDDFDF
ncbi:MAG: hypothetical protein M0R76_11400 [Proteobacteria bacterium]|nr:hypothetical protein [Pseudomonadota bacterium]